MGVVGNKFYPPPLKSNCPSLIDPPWQNINSNHIVDGSDICTIGNGSSIDNSRHIGDSSHNGDNTVWSQFSISHDAKTHSQILASDWLSQHDQSAAQNTVAQPWQHWLIILYINGQILLINHTSIKRLIILVSSEVAYTPISLSIYIQVASFKCCCDDQS